MTHGPRLPAAFLTCPLAHRGYHDRAAMCPENSRAAARAAIAAGYSIELDLQLSADNQAMVFHDATLDRQTSQTGYVRARTQAELAQITLRDGEESIPSLPEFLALVDGAVPLLIEMKDQTFSFGPGPAELAHATARALKDYTGPVAVMSFNPYCIAEFGRLRPDIARGLVTQNFNLKRPQNLPDDELQSLTDMTGLALSGATFISHDRNDLHAPAVAKAEEQGLNILCWTIRTPAQETEALMIAQNITFEGYPAPLTRQ